MNSPPRVAAVVLNYNGREVTLQALASLTAMSYPRCDLLVVDNGSTDGSFAAVAAAFPAVEQVRTERNLGPAGGVNLGLEWALRHGSRDYDYVLVLEQRHRGRPRLPDRAGRGGRGRLRRSAASAPRRTTTPTPKRIWSAGGQDRASARR